MCIVFAVIQSREVREGLSDKLTFKEGHAEGEGMH